MHQEFRIRSEDQDRRIDHFLVGTFPDHSRSQMQKWVKHGLVTVNGKTVSKHHFLDEGDVVVVDVDLEGVAAPSESDAVDIPILYEDDDIIVINKPNTVLTHPAHDKSEWTVAHFLLKHCPGVEGVGEDPDRPGIVHRLDKKASGVMVAAKNQEAFEKMKEQFMDRRVQKEYRAIVHGVPADETGVVRFKLARSTTKNGKMAARPEHQEEGRDAWTEYDVLETRNKRYALLAVRIKTGRQHQIRAHMAAIGHPIVGDRKYVTKDWATDKEYPRMFLHAYRLAFAHPRTGEPVEFIAPLPEEFNIFLKA
ncbi:MAG: RluA family pseudouridine synthase [Candidatus Kerfeldbacteria bacterium]